MKEHPAVKLALLILAILGNNHCIACGMKAWGFRREAEMLSFTALTLPATKPALTLVALPVAPASKGGGTCVAITAFTVSIIDSSIRLKFVAKNSVIIT